VIHSIKDESPFTTASSTGVLSYLQKWEASKDYTSISFVYRNRDQKVQ